MQVMDVASANQFKTYCEQIKHGWLYIYRDMVHIPSVQAV